MKWSLVTVPIKQLKENPKNPRQLSKKQAEDLQKSLDRFGLIDKPIINTDNQIIGGHQRVKLLKKSKVKEVECWMPDRTLTDDEVDELCIRHNKNTGEWDWDVLADQWDPTDLVDWGFTVNELVGPEAETIDEISLPDGEKGFKSINFTLTDEQLELVERCLKISKDMGDFVETGNENINGNALARICELWSSQNGKS